MNRMIINQLTHWPLCRRMIFGFIIASNNKATRFDIAPMGIPENLANENSISVPAGNKPLPEPMLNLIYVTILRHQAQMSYIIPWYIESIAFILKVSIGFGMHFIKELSHAKDDSLSCSYENNETK